MGDELRIASSGYQGFCYTGIHLAGGNARTMTLGSVGKAEAGQFDGSRKLLLVPLVTALRDDEELRRLVARYWEEVSQQVRSLEASLGLVSQLYHQGFVEEGDEALASLEKGNPLAYPFLKETCLRGARLRPTEEMDALLEAVDLQRCLLLGLLSSKVLGQVSDWYREAERRRYEGVARRIDETLERDQVGLLVIDEDHGVQFPQDIQVIYVAPPSLNDIRRWLRDHPPTGRPPAAEEPPPSAEEPPPDAG